MEKETLQSDQLENCAQTEVDANTGELTEENLEKVSGGARESFTQLNDSYIFM